MIPAQEARVIVRPNGTMIPAPEAHRTIAGGKRGEAERAHRMGREERNIRPGGRQSLPETKSSSAPAGAVRYSGAILYRWVRSASPRFPPAIVRCAFRRRGTSR